jgi:hypothetical protein
LKVRFVLKNTEYVLTGKGNVGVTHTTVGRIMASSTVSSLDARDLCPSSGRRQPIYEGVSYY